MPVVPVVLLAGISRGIAASRSLVSRAATGSTIPPEEPFWAAMAAAAAAAASTNSTW